MTPAIENITLESYEEISRRDRTGQWGGGVALFAHTNFAPRVTLLQESENAERVWASIHSDQGPVLVCAWYRPPAAGEVDTISSFKEEFLLHSPTSIGAIVVGDVNVHSVLWLQFSARETQEGECMRSTAADLGLKQFVEEPTRGDYLLDLVLSNLSEVKVDVIEKISDHRAVLAKFTFSLPQTSTQKRFLWYFRQADWQRLQENIADIDWEPLKTYDPSAGALLLTQTLLKLVEACVPSGERTIVRSTHPWLTSRAEQAVRRKREAEGTSAEQESAEECSSILMEERVAHAARTRDQLTKMKKGSKLWWAKAKELLCAKTKLSNIPALKVQQFDF